MSTIASHIETMIPEPDRCVHSRGAEEGSLASPRLSDDQDQDIWQKFIDDQLIEWGRDPSLLEEDDLIPPTQAALDRARRIVADMMRQGAPAPMRVVPDRDGGIAFERWVGDKTFTIMVSEDGAIEVIMWVGSKIIASQRIG